MYYRQADRCSLLLYVDDALIATLDMTVIDIGKASLTAKWKWPDIGEASFILGFKVERNSEPRELKLGQIPHIQCLLERFGIEGAPALITPVGVR
jgi:hypothetical protein